MQPAVADRGRGGLGQAPIAWRHAGALDQQFATLARAYVRPHRIDDARQHRPHRLADGADLAARGIFVADKDRGAGLGHAEAEADGHALGQVGLQQRPGHRRAPRRHIAHAGEVRLREARVLAQEQVHRRHREEHGNALAAGAVELAQHHLRLELPHDVHRAARVQHRVGIQVQAAGVEERQHVEEHVVARDLVGQHRVDGVEVDHAIGLDHALGLAGGAGGIEQVPGLGLIAARHLDDAAGGGVEHRLVLGPAAGHVGGLVVGQVQHRAQRHGARQIRGYGQEAVAGHQHLGRAVLQDRQQLRRRQAPVQAHHHHAGLGAAIQHLEIVRAVVRQHRHARARRQLQVVTQVFREAAGAFVEVAIGHLAAALHVHQRDLVGEMLRVLVQPVDDVHALASAQLATSCTGPVPRSRPTTPCGK
ncbi:hypothetical protein D9M68_160620 [compost metagenome]